MSFLGAQNSIALGVQGLIHIDTGGGAGGSADYLLAKSLRFRSSASAYLNRTPAVSGNTNTWTWSGWVKRGTSGFQAIYNTSLTGNSNSTYGFIGFTGDNLLFYQYNLGTTYTYLATTQLFRDYAAWYHIAIAYDDTQATASDRVKIYVNGAQVTSFSTATYPTASFGGYFNRTQPTYFAKDAELSAGAYFDGEMAEINFVDGQALAPTAFGASSIYNQWLPKKYAGTYGTNGFYLPFSGGTATSYAGSFNGSTQYLKTADSTAFDLSSGDWTIEAWYYLAAPPVGNGFTIVSNCNSNTGAGGWGLMVASLSQIYLQGNNNSQGYISFTSALNTWYHVAVIRSGTGANSSSIYVNGVKYTPAGNGAGNPTFASTNVGPYMGYGQVADSYANGYISNVRVVKGTSVYGANPASITPPSAPLTAVSGTSLLTLQNATIVDNSTNAFTITNNGTVVTSVQSPFLNPTVLTADSSGNANNWTPNNISLTAGSTYDSLTDVPTLTSATVANYCVLNPLSIRSGAPASSDGNLTIAWGGTYPANALATIGVSTGKWYWEVGFAGGTFSNDPTLGIAVSAWSNVNTYPVGVATPFSHLVGGVGNFYNSGATTANAVTFGPGDTVGVALNCDTNAVSFYKNNTLIGSAQSIESGQTWFPFHVNSSFTALTQYANFGQQPFVYTAPSGFLPLNTFNIPAGTVTTSGTFTGNASTDGPFVFLNGTPTAMTINGNAVTFGTHADKLANGFKVRSSSASYNASGSNTYVVTTVGEVFKYEEAQVNP